MLAGLQFFHKNLEKAHQRRTLRVTVSLDWHMENWDFFSSYLCALRGWFGEMAKKLLSRRTPIFTVFLIFCLVNPGIGFCGRGPIYIKKENFSADTKAHRIEFSGAGDTIGGDAVNVVLGGKDNPATVGIVVGPDSYPEYILTLDVARGFPYEKLNLDGSISGEIWSKIIPEKGGFLISAATSGDYDAADIRFSGACGSSAAPFTVALDNSDEDGNMLTGDDVKAYKFYASSEKKSVAIGSPGAYSSDDSSPTNYVYFNPNGASLRAGCCSFNSYCAAVGVADASADHSHWTIGDFGNRSVLYANSSSRDGSSHSAAIGAGEANGTAGINNWTIGKFGDHVTLTASSRYSSWEDSYYACSSAVGIGNATSSGNFNHWKIGNFGEHATLSASSKGYNYAHASVVGIGSMNSTSDGSRSSNWKIGNFGKHATLSASSEGLDSCSSVVGIAYVNDAPYDLSNWSIGNFDDDATLSALSMGKNTIDNLSTATRGNVVGIARA
jgi:hypothetical protein